MDLLDKELSQRPVEAAAADSHGASWDVQHTELAASHHELGRHLGDVADEAEEAVRAESASCGAIRRTLERAQALLRGLGVDSEGLWFSAYVILSALVVVAEIASGIATAWLVTVPPAVRSLLMIAFITFPPLTAIALGEVLRPWRFRQPVGMQFRLGAALLVAFAVTYLTAIYRLRALSVGLAGDDALLPNDVEAAALTIIAGGGYLLAVVGAVTRSSWHRFVLTSQIRRLKRDLKVHEARLARARIDLARAKKSSFDEDHPPNETAPDKTAVQRPAAAVATTAAIAFVVLAAITPGAAAAAPAPRCAESVAWIRAAIPADSRLALLITTQPVSDEQRALDRAMAKAVIGCAGARTTITVRAITETSLTDAPVWQGVTPNDAPVSDPYGPARGRSYVAQGDDTIDRVMSATPAGPPLRSDILGALQASGQDWSVAPRGGVRVAVIVASAWQQSRDVNMFVYKSNAAAKIDETLRKLQHDGTLPDLQGVSVYIVGLTPGAPGMGTTGAGVRGICTFWSAVVTAAKGELKLCAGSLPGIARGTRAPTRRRRSLRSDAGRSERPTWRCGDSLTASLR